MRAVVQRVSRAEVRVDSEVVGAIAQGLCVFVAVVDGDGDADARALANKVANLRVFVDERERMNRSVLDVAGQVLAISQFTLAGDVRKGNRPSFVAAMEPGRAKVLFESFCSALVELNVPVETGRFRSNMDVTLTNDGPVTILLDTTRVF